MRFLLSRHRLLAIGLASIGLLVVGSMYTANAAQLPNRSLQIEDSKLSESTRYQFSFETASLSPVASIRFQFCQDSPLIDTACDPPTGFDASAAVLEAQSGSTGFSLSGASDTNTIILTRPSAPMIVGTNLYELSAITNPSAVGTYFVRVQTYSSPDATGSSIDEGGLAFAINEDVNISTTVPPYLLFCLGVAIVGFDCSTATGNYVNFGEFTPSATKAATTQMLAATNSDNGYAISIEGITMASGTDFIPAIPTSDVSRPGTSQFGLNLTANSSPPIGSTISGPGAGAADPNYDISDRFRFVSGDRLAFANSADDHRKYTVSYIVNVANTQSPGIYVSTLTYNCLSTF